MTAGGNLLLVIFLIVTCAESSSPDSRPLLTAAARPAMTSQAAEQADMAQRASQQAALERLKQASRVVSEAAYASEVARERLKHAREAARAARDELERQRELGVAASRSQAADQMLAEHTRTLTMGRIAVLFCLFGFTFMNGLARRSLSSAAPSMVAEGLLTSHRADEIFMTGFQAFAVGKFLVVFATLWIGLRRSLLLQLFMMAASCVAYLVAPARPAVQVGAWMVFRIFSGFAVSTMIPFVGAWFPRPYYGRIFAVIFCGFQLGYLTCSYYWQHLLFAGKLHWRVPFTQCTAGFVILFAACVKWLHERPPQAPTATMLRGAAKAEREAERAAERAAKDPEGAAAASAHTAADAASAPEEGDRRVQLGALLHKVSTRWVFWAMLLACATYSPAVEYSTHVTSYLKEMASAAGIGSPQGFVCMQSTLCEGRYRGYVVSYVTALLLGSVLYDRATQLDRAFLVLGLLGTNVVCWLLLALAEPNAPAAAWVKTVAAADPGRSPLVALSAILRAAPVPSEVPPAISLSGPTKTALASLAGATIALPTSLPFALFALDFGKEGAAVLSALLSVVGAFSALAFLRSFPNVVRHRGWFGVHALLASLGLVSSLAMGAIMLSDSKKFSRGYVIRSSLLDETVVTLHACSRPSCINYPMWRPGQRRLWGPFSGTHVKPHAPTSLCHHCGRGDRLVECSVDEAAADAALKTPFESCSQWVREEHPLKKPKQGWAFANDPVRFPLA
mmetsp:Transcript_4198/g.10900  ORF Transcript_4198/g.10900 Transcript_4198/m.10900 type:complete len:736 (+) Transcript_4198:97-2304(+)